MSDNDIQIVRDVGTLVEFAPTEKKPPPVPKKLFNTRSDEAVTQKFGSLTRSDGKFRREKNGTHRKQITNNSEQILAVPSSNGNHFSSDMSLPPQLAEEKPRKNAYSPSDKGVYFVTTDGSPNIGTIVNPTVENVSKDRRISEHTQNSGEMILSSASADPNSKSPYVSHAIITVCSLLYCLILTAVGLAFPLAYLIMYRSRTFNVNIYQGYFIYLYVVGIVIQLVYLFKKLCDTCDSVYSKAILLDFSFRAFGTKGVRTFAGVFGIFSCLWLVILFAWRIDVFRETGMKCASRGIEVAVIALALVYTLLHIFIVFYNTKLMVTGHELYILMGLMHLVATDIGTWAWAGVNSVLTTLVHRNHSGLSMDICDMSSSLTGLVTGAHPYFGLVTLVFFLISSFLLLSIFLHHHEKGTFFLSSTLDQILKDAVHLFSLGSNFLGLLLAGVLSAGATVFLVYHYLLIGWGRAEEAWLSMEILCFSLELVSLIICAILIFIHHSKSDTLSRPLTLETLVICISIFFLFIHNIGYCIACLKMSQYIQKWAAAASITEVFETLLQAALLLSALKYYAKFFGQSAFRIQQSATLFMFFYNLWMAVFLFVRQQPGVYDKAYLAAFGPWFYGLWTYFLLCFKVLYRLFSCSCYGSLWIRAFRS